MRKLNTAQKIILVIGLIALAIRCFTYEPIIEPHWEGIIHRETKLNYTIAFHCLGIIAVTSVLMLLAGVFGGKLEPYLADKRKLLLWVGISAGALVVIGAITWGVYYYLESHPLHKAISPSKIELFDMQIDTGYATPTLSGRVKNNSSMEIYKIELHILVYDSAGKYIDTGAVTINGVYVLPGEVRSFRKYVSFSATLPYGWSWNSKIISIEAK